KKGCRASSVRPNAGPTVANHPPAPPRDGSISTPSTSSAITTGSTPTASTLGGAGRFGFVVRPLDLQVAGTAPQAQVKPGCAGAAAEPQRFALPHTGRGAAVQHCVSAG